MTRIAGFVRKQFDDAPTSPQRRFDLVAILVVPAILLCVDPGVLRDGEWGLGLLRDVRWLVYSSAVCTLCTYTLGVLRGSGAHVGTAAGVLFGGGLVSLAVGIALLPFSLLFMLVFVGLLGLAPFVTSFALFRDGVRRFRTVPSRFRRRGIALGLTLSLLLPGTGNFIVWWTSAERARHGQLRDLPKDGGISLDALVAEEWEAVHWFGAYTESEQVDETLGFNWNSSLKHTLANNENHDILVFVRSGKVIDTVILPAKLGEFCIEGRTLFKKRECGVPTTR